MTDIFIQTDKQLIPTLERYTFSGRIVVVQSVNEAERAVKYLRTCPILGLDTETRPSFRRGQQNQVALLQIASTEICFLFRLNFMGFPQCLVDLLEDPKVLKVGLSLKDDFRQLRQRHAKFTPQNYIELQLSAHTLGTNDMSLAKLFANFFRLRISKTAQLSNWEADSLDEKQRLYAATDASACILLHQRIEELRQSGQFRLIPPPEGVPLISPSFPKETSSNKLERPRRRKRKTTPPPNDSSLSSNIAPQKVTIQAKTKTRKTPTKRTPQSKKK